VRISGKKRRCGSNLFSRASAGHSGKNVAAAAFAVRQVDFASSPTLKTTAATFFPERPQDIREKASLRQQPFFPEIFRISGYLKSPECSPNVRRTLGPNFRKCADGTQSQNRDFSTSRQRIKIPKVRRTFGKKLHRSNVCGSPNRFCEFANSKNRGNVQKSPKSAGLSGKNCIAATY
jgi:hypothetical protein